MRWPQISFFRGVEQLQLVFVFFVLIAFELANSILKGITERTASLCGRTDLAHSRAKHAGAAAYAPLCSLGRGREHGGRQRVGVPVPHKSHRVGSE